MKATALNRAVASLGGEGALRASSINVPALAVILQSKDLQNEIELLRRRLQNGHEAVLLPPLHVQQEDGRQGSHLLMQVCAISRTDAEVVPPSDYPQYDGIEAEWVVISEQSYEKAIPEISPGSALSEVRLEAHENGFFVTSTLLAK